MVFNGVKNYYEILEISADAEASDIKAAYRRLVRKYHPDINKNPDSVEIFKQISLAYETLSDEYERKKYDILNGIFKESKIENDVKKNNAESNDNNSDINASSKPDETAVKSEKVKSAYSESAKIKKNKSKKKFSLINYIKYLFAKIRKYKNEKEIKKPVKGENIRTEVIVSPEEVIMGSRRTLNIRTTVPCPKCLGHKFTNGAKCSECGGRGTITETKKITISVPKGVADGTKLRIKGEGASGKYGGANGDIYVIIRIETKNKIQFNKLDICRNVPVTPFEAALGEEISIPSFDGKIKLKLPKNTCSGQKFRIAGQGLKKNGKIGDLIVTISIEFSHNLSEDEIKLYEQLKSLSKDNARENLGYGS